LIHFDTLLHVEGRCARQSPRLELPAGLLQRS
jgi:hypothetical protein